MHHSNPKNTGQTLVTPLLLISLTSIVLLIGILAAVPPVSRDALTHHLAVPKLYLQHGGIYEIPSIVFSYYPMNVDLLYLLPLALGNDIAPNYIHFGFALLTAWFVFRYLKRKIDRRHALLGALLFLTTPIIMKLSISAYVDLGLIFFSTAAVLYLIQWADSGFTMRHLFYSAIFCGLAMGTKYNGMILLLFLTLFVPIVYIRSGAEDIKGQFRAMRLGSLYCLMALLVFSPWMIRNYIWTHNPVYPLYNHWFNPQKPQTAVVPSESDNEEVDGQAAGEKQKWGPFRIRKIVFKESWMETATIPLRIFFQGKDDDPKFFDGKLNPFLLIFPLLAFLPGPVSSENDKQGKKLLAAFSILYLLFVFVQIDMRIRWITPIVPPLVILSVFGIHRAEWFAAQRKTESAGNLLRWILYAAVLLSLGMNMRYLRQQFDVLQPWGYISGSISRSDYIRKFRPEYPVIEFANRKLPPNAEIVALFIGNRIYYSDHHLDCNYNRFFDMVKRADSAEDLYDTLTRRNVSHLLVRFDLLQEWMNTMLSEPDKNRLAMFFQRQTRLLYAKDGHGLFALTDEPGLTDMN